MEQTITEKNIASMLSNQMADAVERVSSALVLVNGRQGRPASGIVYAQDLVLTADHVLEREDDLTIETHDQRTLPAQFAGREARIVTTLVGSNAEHSTMRRDSLSPLGRGLG